MRFNLVRWAPGDVGTSAICTPAGVGTAKAFVRISDPPVVFISKFVLRCAWGRVALFPKSLDELVTRVIAGQTFKREFF